MAGILNSLSARIAYAAQLRVDRTSFAVGIAPAALIATLSDPFAAKGMGTTTYATFGTVPGQLSLSGNKIVAGSTSPASNGSYSISVVATSGTDLKSRGETFTFRAVAGPGPVERSLGTTSEVPLFNVNGVKPAYISFDVMDGNTAERKIEIGIAGKDATNTPLLTLYDRGDRIVKDYDKMVNGVRSNIIANNSTDLTNASVPYRAVCKVTADGSIDCYLEGATRTNLLEAPYNSTAFNNGAIMGAAIYMRVLSGPALNNVKYFPG